MKFIIAIAAILAASTSVSAASMHDRGPGHWEWQTRQAYGPNKSNLPIRVRTWVRDKVAMANCDCAMMQDKASSSACMTMPERGAGNAKG